MLQNPKRASLPIGFISWTSIRIAEPLLTYDRCAARSCSGLDFKPPKCQSNMHHSRRQVDQDSLSASGGCGNDHIVVGLVTREVGFRYIWIDALCIVQDDKLDVEKEIGKMGQIYRNSSLTIGAAKGSDVTSGLFAHRDPYRFRPCFLSTDYRPLLGETWAERRNSHITSGTKPSVLYPIALRRSRQTSCQASPAWPPFFTTSSN